MDLAVSCALGVAVRVLLSLIAPGNTRLEATVIGVWEGVALYRLADDMLAASPTPIILAVARFYLDYIISRDSSKVLVSLLWTAVSRLACEILKSEHWYDTTSELRRARRRASISQTPRGHERGRGSVTLTDHRTSVVSTSTLSTESSSSSGSSSTTIPTVIKAPKALNPPVKSPLSTSSARSPRTNRSTGAEPAPPPPPPPLEPPSTPKQSAPSETSYAPASTHDSPIRRTPPKLSRLDIPSAAGTENASVDGSKLPTPTRIIPNPLSLPTSPEPKPRIPTEESTQDDVLRAVPLVKAIIADETASIIDEPSIMQEGSVLVLPKEDEPSSPLSTEADDTLAPSGSNGSSPVSSSLSGGLTTDNESESVLSTTAKAALLGRAEIYRTQAREEFDKARQLQRQRDKALKQRDVHRAFMLYSQLKRSNELVTKLNMKAARRLFLAHNEDTPLDTIDVHGLQRDEAKSQTERAIRDVIKAGRTRLDVIVGKGKHSLNGIPVLKRTIIEYLNEEYSQFNVKENPLNAGVLIITFRE